MLPPPTHTQSNDVQQKQPLQVHLSHNRIGVEGAAALLRAIPAGPGRPPPKRPLWLRLEWNRVSLERLVQVGQQLGGDVCYGRSEAAAGWGWVYGKE